MQPARCSVARPLAFGLDAAVHSAEASRCGAAQAGSRPASYILKHSALPVAGTAGRRRHASKVGPLTGRLAIFPGHSRRMEQ
jgi:hypothetical protein